MYLLLWILFGAIVGWLASILTHNNNRMGIMMNIVVGLIGSMIGGWIASAVIDQGIDIFTWQGFVFSILGAVILLVVVNFFARNRRL